MGDVKQLTIDLHLAMAIVAPLFFAVMAGISNWWKWCFSADTFRPLEWRSARISPFLIIVASLLWILRRLSLWEHIKHLGKTSVPWKLDVYLILWWLVVISITFSPYRKDPPRCFPWIALFVVLQIAQTNFYHEFWRTIYSRHPSKRKDAASEAAVVIAAATETYVVQLPTPESAAPDLTKTKTEDESTGVFLRLRNLIIAFSSLAMVTWLFGLFYWWQRHGNFQEEPQSIWDAIYFAFVTASTLGYGDIHPTINGGVVQAVVVFQIVVSLFLVVALLGQCVSGVGALPELDHKAPGAL